MVEQWNRYGRTVHQGLLNRGTVMVEQWKRGGGTVEQ